MEKRIIESLRENGISEIFADTIVKYISTLSKHVDITGVLLYGSVARKKAHPKHSDIDLIIISPNFDVPYSEIVNLRYKIAKELPSGVDAMWIGEEEVVSIFKAFTGVILDALYEGIILFDKKGILTSLKEKLLKALKTGIIRRHHGMWKRPDANSEVIFSHL